MKIVDGRDAAAVADAAARLAAGELVAFPTETVYGLGARADDDAAVAKIFALKGRPAGHPLIVHVADRAGADRFGVISPLAERLVESFWPGPVTVIVRRVPGAADAAAAGQATIGLRSPAHPVAHALLVAAREAGVAGVAAPSANRFGRLSPTAAEHVHDEFGDVPLLVLDGGATRLGIESAIVDCSRARPVLLRPGVLSRERLETALGTPLDSPDLGAPRAPGTLASHYAPRARLRVMPTQMLRTALDVLGPEPLKLAVYSRSVPSGVAPGVRHRRMPARPEQAAHELFAVLRELDNDGVPLIWVEEPPPGPEWDGVRDRLGRAAATT
jgi:L-threonylcarbamoyladenylate synthase